MKLFSFDESIWVNPMSIGKDCHSVNDETIQHLKTIQNNHTELGTWGTFAILYAFGDYSMDILEISWAYWITERDPSLLGYIYIEQKLKSDHNLRLRDIANPLISELADYSETSPWLNNSDIPSWILQAVEQRNLKILENQIDEFIEYIATKGKYITISDEQREIIQNKLFGKIPNLLSTNEKFTFFIKNLDTFELAPEEYNKLSSLIKLF